ncbi:longitudinals lacking protein, isoforms A/B/D/L isoform X13 [Zootermopsis nevadensis]|uniref:longitudinals lacking protein, isoforms A/B/D/L isoform X13 n=1 Tax=Zootermopsis nevadensis TaxID=136037 RepID=UPI000B8E5474|nr:longitudinals lacking protein, isoforms A/B/D/L isoform X13 [Zootermopsis nevadensis]
MGSEQQFCLKWNNHQSTIVAGFDTLLESGTLVDCTLAAEGQYLKAHKVVLSACSPYFELLLSQHDEKHPIVILKDIKFQELKAMVDYMYHGEVNISQDQLGALLKAAESLQIKGLSDSGGGGSERENVDKRHHGTRKQTIPPPQPRSSPVPSHSSTVGHRRQAPLPPAAPPQIIDLPEDDDPPPPRPPPLPRVPSSREGSPSPPPKRKRHRRRSSGEEGSLSAAPVVPLTEGTHETSSSSELPPQSQPAPSASVPSIPANITPVVPPSAEPATHPSSQASEQPVTETELLNPPQVAEVASPRQPPREMAHEQVLEPVQKLEPPSEVLLEPKSEYLEDDMNEDSVEDLTLDDDMDEIDQARPGPSHGGEGSSQGAGFAPWHVADQSRDEVFMAAQESVGAQRDSQEPWSAAWRKLPQFGRQGGIKETHSIAVEVSPGQMTIPERNVANVLQPSGSLNGPGVFQCPNCGNYYKYKRNMLAHLKLECGMEPQFQCQFCPCRYKQKSKLQIHVGSKHRNKVSAFLKL